ncbi:hypothetical protein ABB37_04933 [Leptomonas pyrrhocoris]|uniref:TFIIS central domain-containing protein n=1 Tax=Leptomonas pyrrhocoris TaxID=157538 RepID=A0A0N0VF82_LEPPY|nr:hypothetical protein ABB37_04933 [Leptomonas pyrrhocoris]XP_015658291.1 hypothetical protein ABB37_04933 [Leptomonas pyrrhocoris]KPA79851.1 hypothetical protein ABB37_04933 [Leptomonas pyrrhocoris]KPA79852.1 hypothetical protein ABB37_04933 [Leptomonas pyrrhocoris]|eukprot:XP_015658290.1 hypothetical protein ABB37_04933 [Leptomonas pyrrhocoris]
MASSTSSPSGSRDEKIVRVLSTTFQRLDDFNGRADEATAYATAVVAAARANNGTEEEFKDQVMCIVANVRNLNGQIRGTETQIAAAELAVMDANAMRTHQQKQKLAALHRKRAREQTSIDKTSLHCTKCGLVRRDRLNINELALDSEESGSHFDYNYDNVCTCSHSSEEESDGSEEEQEADDKRKSSKSSSTRSGSESS